MEGYGESTYGEAFAEVYDEWYADVTDVEATVALMADLAGPGGSVLELGVGTGRLAIPMADAGLAVTGIDTSTAMLDRLRAAGTALGDGERDGPVTAVVGDMVDDLPPGPFDAVLVAYNTIFNLRSEARQRACFAAVAARLRVGGHFVVEAIVPDSDDAGSTVSLRSMTADRVVLSVSRDDPAEQRSEGQFVELSERSGVRLRPWSIRWATPAQLDAMASDAGLRLRSRWSTMRGAPYESSSEQHVSVYTRPDGDRSDQNEW